MKPASFIEFSSWIIQNAERNLLDVNGIFGELTSQFWPATKVRNERWRSLLCEMEPGIEFALPNDDRWGKLVAACDEIILSETVSRVWFAVLISRTANDDLIDIAQCIIPDHANVRKCALKLWDRAPQCVSEFADRTQMIRAMRDQANDLMLSQVSEEVVGRNLSISLETFDNFYACKCEFQPEVLKKANRVLARSYSTDIAKLSPLECPNLDLHLKICSSICNTFNDAEIMFPEFVSESLLV